MFNQDSAVVKIWVNEINTGNKTQDDIPNISNLRDIVLSLLSIEE